MTEAEKPNAATHTSVGAWAKRFHFASRAAMDNILRPYGLGATQWYVLYQLANHGPTLQRDLVQMLNIERATMSGVVATLVQKGLVSQTADKRDQRQRMLRITRAGSKLWEALPNPIDQIKEVAFHGADQTGMRVALEVLRAATKRLTEHDWEGDRV